MRLYAGATVGAWYPITPSTSVMDAFSRFCERYRTSIQKRGNASYCIIQAEDELSAMGMVLGASWNGARAFTPTSGPGISLMSEFLGYGYFAEIPAVLIDVQRCGPSTGMPTRTQQADIMSCAFASHGDTRQVLAVPGESGGMFLPGVQAFDLAERLQTPVIVLTDLDIGMNDWMCKDLQWDDNYVPDRGKVLNAEDLENDGVFPPLSRCRCRCDTVPDISGRTSKWRLFHPRLRAQHVRRIYRGCYMSIRKLWTGCKRKWETAKNYVPSPVIEFSEKNKVGIISIGSCDAAGQRGPFTSSAEDGIGVNYMRVKAFPFTDEVAGVPGCARSRIRGRAESRCAAEGLCCCSRRQVEQDKLEAKVAAVLRRVADRSAACIIECDQRGSWRKEWRHEFYSQAESH